MRWKKWAQTWIQQKHLCDLARSVQRRCPHTERDSEGFWKKEKKEWGKNGRLKIDRLLSQKSDKCNKIKSCFNISISFEVCTGYCKFFFFSSSSFLNISDLFSSIVFFALKVEKNVAMICLSDPFVYVKQTSTLTGLCRIFISAGSALLSFAVQQCDVRCIVELVCDLGMMRHTRVKYAKIRQPFISPTSGNFYCYGSKWSVLKKKGKTA